MRKIISFSLLLTMVLMCLVSCGKNIGPNGGEGNNTNFPGATGTEITTGIVSTEKTQVPSELEEKKNTLVITCDQGTDACWTLHDQTLTFSNIQENTVCSILGEFDGQIVIDVDENYSFELTLCGATLYSGDTNPILILSGDKVTITAKKDTKNYIYDTRNAIDDTNESEYSSAVEAYCDLHLGGKGELTVVSEHNNGIHTRDNLKIDNLTLSVTCEDNALKGNDGVTVLGGEITLIAKTGDGIKTTNSDVSAKGNQRGIVSISSGKVDIYAACDGIDAAYDCDIGGDAVLSIFTHSYSPYSGTVSSEDQPLNDARYIRFTSSNYSYSVKYYNSESDYKWVNATYYKTISGGRTSYYYYSIEKLDGYSQVQFYIYSQTQAQGQGEEYLVCSDYMEWNNSYDTFALEQRGNSLSYNWTNYTTNIEGGFGGHGGFGGMGDGNKDKGEYSTQGIKAGNEIHIDGGVLSIKSYDDAIHAKSGVKLQNGATSTGKVTITNGDITIFSKDDAIHADGTLWIVGGNVNIVGSYEGLEGNNIVIDGGNISVVSSDDGINASTSSGVGIEFNGGTIYVYAGGDGLDSNSRTSYQGILFQGSNITVISTTSMNSSIDTEQGYTYSAGSVLAICPSNGMGSEATKCQNFSSVATRTSMSLKSEEVLTVTAGGKTVASVLMPCTMSSLVIYLGSNAANFSTK